MKLDRKTILYIILGVLIFSLWEVWKTDYQEKEVSKGQEKKEIFANSPHTDVLKSYSDNSLMHREERTPMSRLVRVHTDVLDVYIDVLGGNIVQADLLKYSEALDQKTPVKILSDDYTRYYVAQSGLFGLYGPDSKDSFAKYVPQQKEYKLGFGKDKLFVKLFWKGSDGVRVTKIYTFTRGKNDIYVCYEIDNQSQKNWEGQFYAQIKRKDFNQQSGWFGFSTYTGAAISSAEIPYEKISFSTIEKAAKNKKSIIRDSVGGWIAMQQRYFLSAWIPTQEKEYSYYNNLQEGIYSIGIVDKERIKIPVGKKFKIGSTLYVGPEIAENISHLAKGLDRTVDYGWLWIISVGFFWALKKANHFLGNWGISIIVITVLIKILFYKLSESSCRSMVRMRELMPKLQSLRDRYSDDRQQLHRATMELYKREKINPLNFGGCLPMLIQIPFFIALYWVLVGAVELRHAPFCFWIKDLSSADPYYIFPVLMGLSMFLQQKVGSTTHDPNQAKVMAFLPVLFTFFFLNFPSGLVLYWFVSNMLSVLQQWYINKKLTYKPKSYKKSYG